MDGSVLAGTLTTEDGGEPAVIGMDTDMDIIEDIDMDTVTVIDMDIMRGAEQDMLPDIGQELDDLCKAMFIEIGQMA